MQKKDKQIEIAFTNNGNKLPTNFVYTCCSFIQNSKLKEAKENEKSIVVGTKEGPIVYFSIHDKILTPYSLFIGHNSCVSDLKLLENNNLVSVSSDGTICIWDINTMICLKKYDMILEPGDLRFCDYPPNSCLYWCLSLGKRADLIDITTGSIIISIESPGIRFISYMSPEKSCYTKEESIAVVSRNTIKLYSINDNNKAVLLKVEHISGNHDEQYVATNFGIVKMKKNSFSIIYEKGTSKEIELNLPKHDSLYFVSWIIKNRMLIASLSGMFFVVNLRNAHKGLDRVTIESIQEYCFGNSFITSEICYDCNEYISFVSGMNQICFFDYKTDTRFSFSSPKKQNNHIYNIPIPNETIIIHSCNSLGFEIYDFMDETAEKVKFNTSSEVTSLYSIPVNYRNNKYMIFAGCKNGSVELFWPDCNKPIKVVDAVSSSVTDFIKLDIKIGGRTPIIVLGNDGSAAIIKWYEVIVSFPSAFFPISEIYFLKKQYFLIFKYADERFITYNLNNPYEVSSSPILYDNCVKIYPCSIPETDYNVISEVVSLGKSSAFFTKIKLNNFKHSVKNCQLLSYYTAIKLLNPEITIKEPEVKISENDDYSLVISGHSNTYTFFFHPFRLTGPVLFKSLPKSSLPYFIAWSIISKEFTFAKPKYIPDQTIPFFLQELIDLLDHGDENIRKTAAISCAKSISFIKEEQALEILESYKNEEKSVYTDYELFVLSIIFVAQEKLVPKSLNNTLYSFLMKKISGNDGGASLAIILLLDGFDFWEEIGGAENILLSILKELLYFDWDQQIISIFSVVAGRKFDIFSHAFDKIISSNSDQEVIRKLFIIAKNIAFANKKQCGTLVSLRIASIGTKYPKLKHLVSEEIGHHAETFKNIAKSPLYFLIGVKGSVSLFRKGEFMIKLNIFESSISHLSISPTEKRACAVSVEERSCKVFNLTPKKTSLMGTRKLVIEDEFTLEGDDFNFSINWDENDKCTLANDA